jgi:hypothetical protein
LPLGYWHTKTPLEDTCLVGPFHYSHRVASAEKTHHLSLFLGNLFYSEVVEGELPQQRPSALAGGAEPDAATDNTADEFVPPDPPETDATKTDSPEPPAPEGSGQSGTAADTSLFPLSASPGLPERRRGEIYRDRGFLWPLSRSYWSAEGEEGQWVIPFYFNLRDDASQKLALFPFYYRQRDAGPRDFNFFRYFFLFSSETWRGGRRWSLGQVLFDWMADESAGSYRYRLLYPIVQRSWDSEGSTFDFTPLCRFSSRGDTVRNYFFPIYWEGSTSRTREDGTKRIKDSHFFLFPFYGRQTRTTRTDYFVLFPFFHLREAVDSLRFELWPFFFWRDEPGLSAARLWPFHADETGVTAGDFWVSRFLFLSKRFETPQTDTYRLDPFIFRKSEGPDSFGIAGLFELFGYDRKGDDVSLRLFPFSTRRSPTLSAFRLWPLLTDEVGQSAGDSWLSRYLYLSKRFETPDAYSYRLDPFLFRASGRPDAFSMGGLFELFAYSRRGTESSFRALPLAFGESSAQSSWFVLLPFHYNQDFGAERINYNRIWWAFFLTSYLRGGDGESHTGVFWRLFEKTANPNRPEYGELGLFYRLFFSRSTETSSSLRVSPFFSYYHNEVEDETQYSFLLSLYRYRRVGGDVRHTLLYAIDF